MRILSTVESSHHPNPEKLRKRWTKNNMSKNKFDSLISDIRACDICRDHLPLGPRPILQVASSAKILIAGQAPGKKVHESGIPFDDCVFRTRVAPNSGAKKPVIPVEKSRVAGTSTAYRLDMQ